MINLKKRKIQKGYALVTSMMFALFALSITSAVLLNVTNNSSQVVRQEKQDHALQLTEAAVSHVLDYVTSKTYDGGSTDTDNGGVNVSAVEVLEDLHGDSASDWLGASNYDTDADIEFTLIDHVTGSNTAAADFIDNVNTEADHSTRVWEKFKTGGAPDPDPFENVTLDELHENYYSLYHVKKDGIEADFKLSMIPLGTNVSDTSDEALHDGDTIAEHIDLFKIRATTYMPNSTNPTSIRSVDLVVQRPVELPEAEGTTADFEHAILSDGTVDMGNKDTTSGASAGTLDTVQDGDVHSNESIIFGSNGLVNGKVTSAGTITFEDTGELNAGHGEYDATDTTDPRYGTDNVTNKSGSKAGVEEIEIPEPKLDDLPTDPCPTVTNNATTILEDCVYTGNLSLTGQTKVVFKGTVRITGNLSSGGTTGVTGSGSTPPKVVVEGTDGIDLGGTGEGYNTIDTMYVAVNGPVTVSGNPGTTGQYGALFMSLCETCTSTFSGNIGFFGALITKGDVVGNGNAGGIQRDTDMSALKMHLVPMPIALDRSLFLPKIVSWVERRQVN